MDGWMLCERTRFGAWVKVTGLAVNGVGVGDVGISAGSKGISQDLAYVADPPLSCKQSVQHRSIINMNEYDYELVSMDGKDRLGYPT